MAKMSKCVNKKNIKIRVLSVVLIIAILCGSFVWFGNKDMDNVIASGTEKVYMQHIMDRITNGLQSKFNILEIVPYDGFGEFRYYLNESEVIDSLEAQQNVIDNWCLTSETEWKTLSAGGFANFGYMIRYNSIDKIFEVKGNDSFLSQAFGEQAGVLVGNVNLNTVEANDLTAEDINEADLIVFSSAPHYSGTEALYNTWKQTTGTKFYTSTGASDAETMLPYYDTYEMVGSEYVSRDMSTSAYDILLDCTINGRQITLSNGTKVTLKTPVILDNTQFKELNPNSNVYKFNLVYRTLCGVENNGNASYVDPSILYIAFKNYVDSNGITSFGTAGNSELNSFFSTYEGGKYSSNIITNCFDSKYDTWLTDYFFAYKGNEVITVPSNMKETKDNTIYFYNYKGWSKPYAHYWLDGGSTTTWPGVPMTHVEGNIYSVKVESYAKKIIFNNKGGEETGTITLIEGKNYYKDVNNELGYEKESWGVYTKGTVIIPKVDYSAGIGVKTRTGGAGSFSDVSKFLLGCKSKQVSWYNYGENKKVRVLEIQPSNSFNYSKFENIKALGEKLLIQGADSWTSSNYTKYIDVTCVTTNALNGMTNDLVADYDVIIIGDDTGILNVDENGKTIYNDRNLNGYVYLAYGDLFKVASNALGLLPSEYETTRYGNTFTYKYGNNQEKKATLVPLKGNAYNYTEYVYSSLIKNGENKTYVTKIMQDVYQGKSYNDATGEFYTGEGYSLGNVRGADNDITDKTKEKLIKYAKSGKTIILSENLYNLDVYTVYPTSDLYAYCQMLGEKDANGNRVYSVYLDTYISGAVNQRYTNNPTVTFLKDENGEEYKPKSPTYDSKGRVKSDGYGSRDMYFKFEITGQAGATYKVKLFVDKNNDGVYKEIHEGILDKNELYYSDKTKLPSDANTTVCEIKSTLSDNFVGMLAWKIDVIQLDAKGEETSYSTSVKGYSAIKNETPKTINILQITHADSIVYTYTENGQKKTVNPVTLNMKTDTEFNKLLSKKIQTELGYNIIIDVVDSKTYENKFKSSSKYRLGQDIGTSRDQLKAYDMVVIGFADLFGSYGDYRNQGEPVSSDISNKNGALDNIKDFIDMGKAVLFTHDTISWRATPNYVVNGVNSGLFMFQTTLLRENGSLAQQNGNTQSQMDYFKRYEETFYDDFAHNITVALRNQVGLDKYGITLNTSDRDDNEKPIYAEGLAPKYAGNNREVQELHGFTPWFIYRNNFVLAYHSDYTGSTTNTVYSLIPFNDKDVDTFKHDRNKPWTTTQVVQLNEGCVTQYPYIIDEEIEVANTHAQYYSVNMEDEDVVVWYTLSGDGTSPSKFYEKTEKDAENNYYIYSKGNITYSGAGHSTLSDVNIDMERKLFVNTLIKAIAGGNNTPVLTIVNGAFTSTGYTVYVNSANVAADYEIHILGKDADLVSLEAADGNTENVGTFKTADVYWIKPDGTEKLIYSYTSTNPLRNGIKSELRLGATNLTATELSTIETLVEGVDGEGATSAKFVVEISDWLGATAKVNVDLVKRDLFLLD